MFLDQQLETQRNAVSLALGANKDVDNAVVEMIIAERLRTMCDRVDLACHPLFLRNPNSDVDS